MSTTMQLLHLRHGWEHRAVPFFQGCWLAATILITGAWDAGSAQAPPPDYSAGVQKLIQLGVPDARQARYVRTESRGGMWAGGDWMGRGPKMTGNAWLLETKTNGTAVVLINQLTVTELVPTKIMEERMQERLQKLMAQAKPGQTPDEESWEDLEAEEDTLPEMEDGAGFESGEWKEADLKADIQSLIDYLTKAGGDNDYELKRSAAGYFLFAVHVHSRGQSAEANQIISLLFQKIGDSRRVLGAAMSRIADVEYGKVYQQFVKTGDWHQYLSAMEGLLGRFSTAWRNGPVVERVAAMVRKQAEQKAAPPVTGEGLTEEDTRVASLLGQTNTVILLHHPVFSGLHWLTSEPGKTGPEQKAAGPLDRIQQRGGKAIPLLAALLKDAWLVRARGGPSGSDSSSDLDDEGMSAEEVEQRMAYFSRPVSRGEIARRILEPLVLDRNLAQNAEDQLTADELAQKSRTWFAQHKTDNRSELMRQLLAEGRQEPLRFLMNSREAADRAAVESYLLNTNKLAENLPSVTQYAQQQGAAVKAFVQQYVAALKKLSSLVPKREVTYLDARSLKQREERARSEIKALEDLISDRTAEQMLQALTRSEKKWNAQEMYKTGAALTAKLAQEDPEKALTLLLQACLKTQDDQLAVFLVQSTTSLRWAQARPPRAAGVPPPKPRDFKIETHADLWRQVLAQERSNSVQPHWGGDTMSFKAQVASAIEALYSDPKTFRGESGLASAAYLGARVYEVTVQRAQARLAGKPEAELPAYPDKAKVSQERRAQIGQLLRDSPKEKQHEIADRLSLDELMAVPDLVSADPKLNEKLVPGSHLIQNVRLTLTNEALARLCLPVKGKALDRKSLESLITECKKLAEQGSNATLIVERRLPLAGVSLNVSADSGPGGMSVTVSGRARAENQVILTAMLQSQGSDGVHAYIQWPVKLAAPSKPEAKSTEPAKPADDDLLPGNAAGTEDYLKRQEEEFWTCFEKLFEPARDACQPYTCVLSVQRSNSMEEE